MSSTIRFSFGETFSFIELYRKNTCLWNINSSYYRNALFRKRAYALIAKEMRLDVSKVKAKINTLRSTYIAELKKVEHGTKTGQTYSPKLVWFEAMSFINDYIIPKVKATNDLLLDQNILTDDIPMEIKQESNKFNINFSSSCRICLQEVDKLDLKLLTECNHENMSYIDLIIFCTGINVYRENNSFPLNICTNCEESLLRAYDFKQQIIKSNYQLENYLATDIFVENFNANSWCDDETSNQELSLSVDDRMVNESCNTENNIEDKKMFVIAEENVKESKLDSTLDSSSQEVCNSVIKTIVNENKTFVISEEKENVKVTKQCNICDSLFESTKELRSHKRSNHAKRQQNYKPKPELCLVCGKFVFAMKKHIDTHKSSSERSSFNCPLCDRVYKIKYNLTQHILLSHTNPNEFRYKCQFCDRKFRFWSTRKAHYFRQHGETPRFICTVCNKEFYVKGKYESHVRTHTGEKPFNCPTCEKTFRTSKQQRYHMVSHTNEKNYKCNVCEKCFPRKRSLGEHMKIHTGEKNYICPVCSDAFIQNHVMRTHVTKKHPDYKLPPPGTITSIKAINKIQQL